MVARRERGASDQVPLDVVGGVEVADRLAALVRDIPDFPRPGITFKDITPLLADPDAFRSAVDGIADRFSAAGVSSGSNPYRS